MLDKLAKKGLSLSIIVGTLLVPLTALAAIWLTDPDPGAAEASAPTTASAVTTVTTQPTTATTDIAADLRTACGPEGTQLVSLEASGSITDIQQAALDALREVCEQQGIPLPSKPIADPIVQTVVVPATATVTTVPDGTTPTSFHFDEDDEDEDEDEYEDEYEDEHGDDEHEDEQHEDDEEDEDDDR